MVFSPRAAGYPPPSPSTLSSCWFAAHRALRVVASDSGAAFSARQNIANDVLLPPSGLTSVSPIGLPGSPIRRPWPTRATADQRCTQRTLPDRPETGHKKQDRRGGWHDCPRSPEKRIPLPKCSAKYTPTRACIGGEARRRSPQRLDSGTGDVGVNAHESHRPSLEGCGCAVGCGWNALETTGERAFSIIIPILMVQ
jgi:hypothetical protein